MNNKAGRGQIQFYLLLDLLHEEAKYVEVQAALVRNDKLSRTQRKQYRIINENIKKMWSSFNSGEITSYQLLTQVAKIYGPREEPNQEMNGDRQMDRDRQL